MKTILHFATPFVLRFHSPALCFRFETFAVDRIPPASTATPLRTLSPSTKATLQCSFLLQHSGNANCNVRAIIANLLGASGCCGATSNSSAIS